METLAQRVEGFINKLTVTTGHNAGQPFELADFQRSFVKDVYRTDDNGRRPVRRAILSGARKIGKSTFAAAISLVHAIGPASERNGSIVIAANSVQQADSIFGEIERFVQGSRALQDILEVVPSKRVVFVKRSDVPFAGSKIKVISAEPHLAHGTNASLIIMDELGQAKRKGAELYEALVSGQKARRDPLFVIISTQNGDPFHFFSKMVEESIENPRDSLVCHLHAADEDCDIQDEAQWKKANPALGLFVDIEEYRKDVEEALVSPTAEQTFRKYSLNQKISLHSGLVYAKDWKALADKDCKLEAGEDIILALDMSSTKDLTALTAISCDDHTRVESWFWKPEGQIRDAVKEDRIRYDLYAKDGTLLTTAGRAIDPEYMFQKILALYETYNVRALVVDRHDTDHIKRRIEEAALDLEVVNFGQGWVSMSPAINVFERAILLGNLSHPDHPLLNFCVLNAVVKSDHAGNRMLDKSAVRMRIDGAVTLTMALGYKDKMLAGEVVATNPYDDDENFSLLTL